VAERAAIKESLDQAGLKHHASQDGHEALLIHCELFVWNVKQLGATLNAAELEEFAPRKAEGTRLRQRCESDTEFANRVRKCCRKQQQTRLELRAGNAGVSRPREATEQATVSAAPQLLTA
jgi:hypothetical protein